MRRGTDRAFTLVELLVVIGIIAMLISILMPALSKAREQSKSLTCLSNLRQIQIGNSTYSVDNRGWYVPTLLNSSDANTDPSTNLTTRKALGWYPQPASLPDPPAGYDSQIKASQICYNAAYARNVLAKPGDPTFNIRYTYGANYSEFMDYTFTTLYLYGTMPPKNIQYKAQRIKNSATKIAWADALSSKIRVAASMKYINEAAPLPSNDMIAYRHFGGVNIAFFDGHAEWMPRKAVDSTYLTQRQIYDLWYPYYSKY